MPSQKEVLKIYEIIDSFLVESQDEYDNYRNLEKLNQDRHLAAKRFIELYENALSSYRQRVVEELEGMKKNEDKRNGTYYENKKYNETISKAQEKIKNLNP